MLTYLKVHLFFTLPVTTLLFLLLFPFICRKELFKINFMLFLALMYTVPWDNYIVYQNAWSYKPNSVIAVIGYVPIEEYAYFIIMTAMVSLWTMFCMRWSLPSLAFRQPNKVKAALIRWIPLFALVVATIWGLNAAKPATKSFYLGCICWWAAPICAFLWYGIGNYCFNRLSSFTLSVAVPTAYLCWVDVVAMRESVWHINEATSYELFVYDNLPLEEFFFFFIVSMIIALGSCACDKSIAVLDTYPHLFATYENPTLAQTVKLLFLAFLKDEYALDEEPVKELVTCQRILSEASKSFNTASFVFHASIRQHLSILYGFCRVTDDMIDEASSRESQMCKLNLIKQFVDELFADRKEKSWTYDVAVDRLDATSVANIDWKYYDCRLTHEQFHAFRAIHRISYYLPEEPFRELIAGYQWDIDAKVVEHEEHLTEYSSYVASSVGTLFTFIIFSKVGFGIRRLTQRDDWLIERARDMGKVLQIVNISRDIVTDSESMGRCYVPSNYLENPETELKLLREERDPWSVGERRLKSYATQMLKVADRLSDSAIKGIAMLPSEVRGSVIAATHVYKGIGTKIASEKEYKRRTRLSKVERLCIAAKSMFFKCI